MVIFLAALKNVPRDLYEVASLDGAGPVRQFFSITLPMISGAMFFNVIILTIAAFQVFDQAYLLFWRDQNNATSESALFYAVYLVAGGQLIHRVGSMRFTAYSMVVATVPAIIQFLLLEPVSALHLPAAIWLYMIVLATLSTVLPLFLQAEALRRIGATEFGLIGALGPVSAAIMSAIGLDEPFTAVQALGGALVIVGVLLVSLKRS
jgi:drug/metabolite transporter (DMT)-like permease